MVDSIQLMRQIAVKAMVTENFKTQVTNEITRNLQQLDTELQQLDFKSKRAIAEAEKKGAGMEASDLAARIASIKAQADAERVRLQQLKDEMQGQVLVLNELPIGSVVTQFTVESPVEVRTGDNIFERLEHGEILIKDGIIQEIKT
jgi:seryl-tRNA synthetase